MLLGMAKLLKKLLTPVTTRDRIVSNSEVEVEEVIAEEVIGGGAGVVEIVDEVEVDMKTAEAVAILFHRDRKAFLSLRPPTLLLHTNSHLREETSLKRLPVLQLYRTSSYHQQPILLNNLRWLGLNSHLNFNRHFKTRRIHGNRLLGLRRKDHLLLEALS